MRQKKGMEQNGRFAHSEKWKIKWTKSRKNGRQALFGWQERKLSFGSVGSDDVQGRHEWGLDRLLEKETNMSKEVIHPSVKPKEVVDIIKTLGIDFQSCQPEETDDTKKKKNVLNI